MSLSSTAVVTYAPRSKLRVTAAPRVAEADASALVSLALWLPVLRPAKDATRATARTAAAPIRTGRERAPMLLRARTAWADRLRGVKLMNLQCVEFPGLGGGRNRCVP